MRSEACEEIGLSLRTIVGRCQARRRHKCMTDLCLVEDVLKAGLHGVRHLVLQAHVELGGEVRKGGVREGVERVYRVRIQPTVGGRRSGWKWRRQTKSRN